jgi:anti-sigma factor RsiW
MSVSFNCEQVYSLLDAYHDGELPAVEESGVASHIGSCAKCHKQLEEIEGVVKSLQNVPKLNMPTDLTADLAFMNRALAAIEEAPTTQNAETKPETEKVFAADKSSSKPARHISIAAPVTVAAMAAAAALALFLTVPRMLKSTQGTAIATHEETHSRDTAKSIQPEKNIANIEPSAANNEQQTNPNEVATQPLTHLHPNGVEKEPLIAEHTPAISIPHKLDESPAVPTSDTNKHEDVTGASEDNSTGVTSENAVPTDHEIATSNASATDGPDIVALYPSDSNNTPTEDLGISTDEDGLYAIKL